MVARCRKWRLQVFENRSAVMFYWAGFSMHQVRGSDYSSSEGRAQSLVSKAYSKNRTLAAELFKQVDADPRILRCAWAGRDDDALRTQSFDCSHRDLIVSAHDNFRAQLTQVLHQVVGERVVIIQDKNHCYQITSVPVLVFRRLGPEAWGDGYNGR